MDLKQYELQFLRDEVANGHYSDMSVATLAFENYKKIIKKEIKNADKRHNKRGV